MYRSQERVFVVNVLVECSEWAIRSRLSPRGGDGSHLSNH